MLLVRMRDYRSVYVRVAESFEKFEVKSAAGCGLHVI